MSVMLYPCMLCVALLMCLFVLCVACLIVVAILLLNVMDVFSVCGGALCILPFGMFCLSAISMMFVKILLAVCMLVGIVV